MADTNPTSTEPDAAKLAGLSVSGDSTAAKSNGTNPTASKWEPSIKSWADDEDDSPQAASNTATGDAKESKDTNTSLDKAQTDGANQVFGGSGLAENHYFDVNVELANLQDDPNDPLFSANTFEKLNLKPEILTALSQQGFRKPSKIQERALPLLLRDPQQNLVGQSQSGTGKTATFVINMLQRIDASQQKPQALVLAPTRELAKQIAANVEMLGLHLLGHGLKVFTAVPDQSRSRSQRVEEQIIVGTPGKVKDMLQRKVIDARAIQILTLDEADQMLEKGMHEDSTRIKKFLGSLKQTVLFSATFPESLQSFISSFAPNANKITLPVEELTVKGIKQVYLDCSDDEAKYQALVKFYKVMTTASSIIFVKERHTALEIERRMTAEGHVVAQLTGGLSPEMRDEVFAKFQMGEAKVLIATNVLARGIDVSTVTMVINYDVPETVDGSPDYETYLHRVGRTGRFGKTGVAISFVHDRKSWQQLMNICKHFQVEPMRIDMTDSDVEKTLKGYMKNARAATDIELDE